MKFTRTTCHLLAAAGLAWATSLPAQAYVSSYVSDAQVSWTADRHENASGEPLFSTNSLYGGTATAVVTPTRHTLNTSDTGHWTLGPAAVGVSRTAFGVAGALGTTTTLSFTVQVQGAWDFDDTQSYISQADFGFGLLGTLGASGWANGGFTLVSCIGCGGKLGGGTIKTDLADGNGTSSTDWPGSPLDMTLTLTGTFENGVLGSARFDMEGSTSTALSGGQLTLSLRSITDGSGQAWQFSGTDGGFLIAAVPEPEPAVLLAGGLLALGWLARRRQAPKV